MNAQERVVAFVWLEHWLCMSQNRLLVRGMELFHPTLQIWFELEDGCFLKNIVVTAIGRKADFHPF